MLQRNCTSWATQIVSFVNEGHGRKGLLIFQHLHKSGLEVNEFVLSAVLKACARLQAIEEGKEAHCMMLKHGFGRDFILRRSLIDMYSKCTGIHNARLAFNELPERDVITTNGMIACLCRCGLTSEAIRLFTDMSHRDVGSWNSLISGLGQNSNGGRALCFFGKMWFQGEKADFTTIVSALAVCADLAALVNGKQIHGLVIKDGFELYIPVGNAAIDMYAKSGCMEDARLCFEKMPSKNVVSWTSLIMGYGKHGLALEALKAFDKMVLKGVVPNQVTFVGTLYACSHAGLIQEGLTNFNTMIQTYSIMPTMEHYTCMVDLFARAGRLDDALDFIGTMPIEPDVKLWTALLSSCCFYKNEQLTRSVGEKLLQFTPQDAGAYMLLSNFYGLIGDWENVARVRRLMLDRGIRKEKACTWIEINRKVHAFESGDRSHPLYKEIHNYLVVLIERMKCQGYVPNTSLVVQNVDEQTKEGILFQHSEKLAIGLGLLSTMPGSRIVIVKNLRMCIDCHAMTGFVSRIEGREIVARDASRFHHFKDGVCSCGDHW
ncbi:hypothetical protein MRB53_000733 [Persea americana]|uniref:Uncharacterized protein n=1 Tax=Persea americana TaxID=3435 RepID=A0ACC2MPR5_PERAE|nr:hypothetical protein MRB53_000733 [Persea americana]